MKHLALAWRRVPETQGWPTKRAWEHHGNQAGRVNDSARAASARWQVVTNLLGKGGTRVVQSLRQQGEDSGCGRENCVLC